MGLIINKKIPMFKKGYPTVSDKYNVAGGILSGDTAVKFGELVIKDTQTSDGCYFKAITTTFTIAALGGFVVATNVKLAEEWPGQNVQVNPGEAFNLLINGFMAIELAENLTSSTVQNIVANGQAAVFLSGDQVGQITYHGATSSDSTPVTATDLPNVYFTGLYELKDGKYLAEIYVK